MPVDQRNVRGGAVDPPGGPGYTEAMKPKTHAFFHGSAQLLGFVGGGVVGLALVMYGVGRWWPKDMDAKDLEFYFMMACFFTPALVGVFFGPRLIEILFDADCPRCRNQSVPRELVFRLCYVCTRCKYIYIGPYLGEAESDWKEVAVLNRHNEAVERGEDPGDIDQKLEEEAARQPTFRQLYEQADSSQRRVYLVLAFLIVVLPLVLILGTIFKRILGLF